MAAGGNGFKDPLLKTIAYRQSWIQCFGDRQRDVNLGCPRIDMSGLQQSDFGNIDWREIQPG